MRAPISVVKLPAPLKYEMVLEALTSGMFSSFVKYVIMFDRQPTDANMSHMSFAGKFYTVDHIHELDQSSHTSLALHKISIFTHTIIWKLYEQISSQNSVQSIINQQFIVILQVRVINSFYSFLLIIRTQRTQSMPAQEGTYVASLHKIMWLFALQIK